MFLDSLPVQFREFLKNQEINENVFQVEQTLRYVRTKHKLTIDEVRKLIHESATETFIDTVYGLPIDLKISSMPLYKEGLLYGIDLSSAAVVLALDLQPEDKRVLEICCAPGAKLSYIGDTMSAYSDQYTLIGVDISQNRLNTTQAILDKYKIRATLVRADGVTFTDEPFDKILIDAECTHEGSIKHLKKFITQATKKDKKNIKQSKKQLKQNHTNTYLTEYSKANEWSEQDFIDRFLDAKKLASITSLQFDLLSNGFKNLKSGGYLVYSTCSFSRKQNEELVDRLLKTNPDAQLVPAFKTAIPCRQENLYCRFDPQISNSSGMFLAKIHKIHKIIH